MKIKLLNNSFNYEVKKEHLDELLFNLKSIKQVLCDENSDDKHGDLAPEILTISDIINQLKKATP